MIKIEKFTYVIDFLIAPINHNAMQLFVVVI